MKAEPANAEPHDPPIDPSVFATTDAAMAALGALADRYNVVIAFRSELASLAALERALKAARCPWFGIDLDPVAVLRDEWNMDELFSRMGALVRHVRGRDAAVGTDRRTKPTPIGGGSTSWGSLLADLDAAGYRQWITIDPTELTDRLGAAVVGRKRLLAFSE